MPEVKFLENYKFVGEWGRGGAGGEVGCFVVVHGHSASVE